MSNPDLTRVWDEVTKALAYVVTSAADFGITLPSRQLVTLGEAVHDCEEVVVAVRIVQTGIPNSLQTDPSAPLVSYYTCDPAWTVIMDISVVRCAPVLKDDGSSPPAASIHASAEVSLKDAAMLMNVAHLRVAEQWGAVAASVAFPSPNGGFQASVLTMSVAVS